MSAHRGFVFTLDDQTHRVAIISHQRDNVPQDVRSWVSQSSIHWEISMRDCFCCSTNILDAKFVKSLHETKSSVKMEWTESVLISLILIKWSSITIQIFQSDLRFGFRMVFFRVAVHWDLVIRLKWFYHHFIIATPILPNGLSLSIAKVMEKRDGKSLLYAFDVDENVMCKLNTSVFE